MSQKQREKKDRTEESQPFQEETLFVKEKIHPRRESNL
jgi:hypothetical protein